MCGTVSDRLRRELWHPRCPGARRQVRPAAVLQRICHDHLHHAQNMFEVGLRSNVKCRRQQTCHMADEQEADACGKTHNVLFSQQRRCSLQCLLQPPKQSPPARLREGSCPLQAAWRSGSRSLRRAHMSQLPTPHLLRTVTTLYQTFWAGVTHPLSCRPVRTRPAAAQY